MGRYGPRAAPTRAGHRHGRLHRALLQFGPPTQLARLPHPERVRRTARNHHPADHTVLTSGPLNGVNPTQWGERVSPRPVAPEAGHGCRVQRDPPARDVPEARPKRAARTRRTPCGTGENGIRPAVVALHPPVGRPGAGMRDASPSPQGRTRRVASWPQAGTGPDGLLSPVMPFRHRQHRVPHDTTHTVRARPRRLGEWRSSTRGASPVACLLGDHSPRASRNVTPDGLLFRPRSDSEPFLAASLGAEDVYGSGPFVLETDHAPCGAGT